MLRHRWLLLLLLLLLLTLPGRGGLCTALPVVDSDHDATDLAGVSRAVPQDQVAAHVLREDIQQPSLGAVALLGPGELLSAR